MLMTVEVGFVFLAGEPGTFFKAFVVLSAGRFLVGDGLFCRALPVFFLVVEVGGVTAFVVDEGS